MTSALDVVLVSLVLGGYEELAVLDVAGAGGCCFLFQVGVDANKSCCFDPCG